MPDGFFDAPTSLAAGAVAATGVAVALRRGREQVESQGVALAGLTAAFVFAAQMVNVPIAAGTSGHVLGGVLAAVLVGPWVAVLCLTVVVTVQCLLFADGGLSALGVNVVNMALVTCLGGWLVFRGVRSVLPRSLPSTRAVPVAAGIAAGSSVVLASVAFTAEYALGGTTDVSVGTVLAAMVGVHTVIGLGEGVVTGLLVAAVLAARPDLVAGARAGDEPPADGRRRLVPGVAVAGAGLGTALLIAACAAPFASTAPDGLERVAADHGLHATGTAVIGSAVVGDGGIGRLAGVAVVLGLAVLVVAATAAGAGRRRGERPRALADLPAHVKVVAALAFVLGVVATPRTAVPVFVLDAVVVAFVAHRAGLALPALVRRLAVELPFVAFALLLPFLAGGPDVAVGPLSLSVAGLWSAWGVLAKATLGVAVAVVLTHTTPPGDLVGGLQRLRVPGPLVAIGAFMVRYGAVLSAEVERLRIARVSRGDDPRWLWQARSVATTGGALFVRSFERGERVQLAMAARGFDGRWPTSGAAALPVDWAPAAAFAAVAVTGAALALGMG